MKIFLRLLFLTVFCLTAGLLCWLSFISLPCWSVQQVIIKNNEYIPQPLILEKVLLPEKISIFKVRTKNIRREILTLPWVQNVKIHRNYPSVLELNIQARKPYFKLPIAGQVWIIDKEGVILNRDGIQIQGYPLYEVDGLTSIADLDQILTNLAALCLELDKSVKPEQVVIDYSRKNNISLKFRSGPFVKLGRADYPAEKVQALTQLWKVLEPKLDTVEYIDLRAYKTPAVKLRG